MIELLDRPEGSQARVLDDILCVDLIAGKPARQRKSIIKVR